MTWNYFHGAHMKKTDVLEVAIDHRNDGDAFTLHLPPPPPPPPPLPHLYSPQRLPLQFGPNPAGHLEKFFVPRFQSVLGHQSFPMIGKFFVEQTPNSQHGEKVGCHVGSVHHAVLLGLQHRRLFGGIYDEQRRLTGLLNNNSDMIDFVNFVTYLLECSTNRGRKVQVP